MTLQDSITLVFLATLFAVFVPVSAAAGTSVPAACGAPDAVKIAEWTIPWPRTRPRDPYVDKGGRVWFVGQTGDYAACFDPETGQFKKFPLGSGTGPHNLIVDARGVWYAGNQKAYIGRLDPVSGDITQYPMPIPEARDPHTLVLDSTGNLWFTVQWGNFVGKMDAADGKIKLVPVPTKDARPYGIVVDGAGRPWIAEFGTNKLGMIDPATMAFREILLPNEAARPRRLAVTSDGAVWFVDHARGFLGRYDPVSGAVREWQAPGKGRSMPYGMAVDDHDRIWFVETGRLPNRLVGFDPVDECFFSLTEIESGGGSVRHMFFHKPTRSIWFGTDTDTIGRADVP